MIETVNDKKGQQLAIIIPADYSTPKTNFISEPTYSQQVGIISYPKGGKIKPHYHNEVSRSVIITQEVLMIRKGRVVVDIYDKELALVTSVTLKKHDVIFLISGGHGFEMLDDCEMLEVKQGPYDGVENDKTHFEEKK